MEASLARPSFSLSAAALKFGDRMQAPLEQFRKCMQLASDFTCADKPTAEQREVLDSQLHIIDDVLDVVPSTDILYHHLHAMCTASAAITCVAADNPTEQLQHITEEAEESIKQLKQMSDASHTELANAVEGVLVAVKQYIEKHCTNSIPISADAAPSPTAVIDEKPPASTPSSRDVSSHTAVHLVDYRTNVVDDAAKSFLSSASKLGGLAEIQAKNVFGAVEAVYDYLVTASQIPNPPDDDEKQTMLQPIIKFMSAASEKGSDCSNRDPLFNHAKALEEAVNMVSWIVATEKPTTFITDADGSASFYLNKILMTTKKQPDASDHKAFVDTLKTLFAVSKAFVKEHYTMGVRYGTGIAVPIGQKKEVTSEVVDATGDTNYLTAFRDLIAGPLATFVEASKVLGDEIEEQSKAFAAAWEAEAEFLAKAICTPKPDDYQDMLTPIATEMGKVGTVTEKCGPRGTFTNHCSAVGESVAVLGWVAVDEKAVSFVGDSADAGQFYLNKVKMGAKSTDNPEAHRAWAAALESLYKDLKAYVKEHHTQKLVWNPPKRARAAPRSTPCYDDDGDTAKDYLTAFKELLTGPLAAFLEASKAIGGEVEAQAKLLGSAWEAEAEFLAKAIGMPKPDNIQDLLSPIAGKMGEVVEIANQMSPRAPLSNHCNSVSESISALGWVAVDEKPVSFIGDMIGAGQFYLNKVKTGAKNSDDAEAHRLWATALETLYADLKAYVKEYHTQKLVWDLPKAGKASIGRSSPDIATGAPASSNYVDDFKKLIAGPLAEFVQSSKAVGGEVEDQAKVFAEAWEAEAEFLGKAIKMPKPTDYQDMLAPIAAKMGAVSAIVEEINPRNSLANHCNAVGEYVAALGWVAVEEKATSFVGDMAAAGEFYLHKVKMGAKQCSNPETHRKWAGSIDQLLKGLKLYVKEHHTQRLSWNKA
ncbi:Adenylate cyclase-associated CAP [Gracilaria domingensis]|nr:Adenylate cyclase-associated CAP [Gracilaria domingensis]